MRRFLVVFGWLSVVGSIGDAVIALYALWVVVSGSWVDWSIEVGPMLEQHLPLLLWVKDVARFILPAEVVAWVFALPALIYFPVRVVTGCVVGWWALAAAKKMGGGGTSGAGHSRAAA